MFRRKRVQCFIFYTVKYESQKSKLKKFFREMNFNVECQKIKYNKNNETKIKPKKKVPTNYRCLILFYLNEKLTSIDTKVVEMYSSFNYKRFRGLPKFFMFYGENSNNDNNSSNFFVPEESEILYIYCKKAGENEFHYINTFADSICSDFKTPIFNIHQKIITENDQDRNSSSVYYFCSMGKHFIINKQGIKDYLSIGFSDTVTNEQGCENETYIAHGDESETGNAEHFDMDKLKSEFGNTENSLSQFETSGKDEDKMKRFMYYFMNSIEEEPSSSEKNKSLLKKCKVALKNTYQINKAHAGLSNYIIKLVTEKLGTKGEYLQFLLDIVYVCIENCPKNSAGNLMQKMGIFLNTLYEKIKSNLISDSENSKILRSLLTVILNIIYLNFKMNSYCVALSVVYNIVKIIYENYAQINVDFIHPIFTYLKMGPIAKFSISFLEKLFGNKENQKAILYYNKMNDLKIHKDLCLIISDNNHSVNKKDTDLIKSTFSQKYHVQEMETNSSETFFVQLLRIKNSIQNSLSKVLIFILTKGYSQSIKLQNDESVPKSDILNHFSSINCEILKNKPKLCFLQTIQNTEKQESRPVENFDKSDFFIGHGNLKEENLENPSYIQTLIELLKSKDNLNLHDIGLKLNEKFNAGLIKSPEKSENTENASFEYCLREKVGFSIDI